MSDASTAAHAPHDTHRGLLDALHAALRAHHPGLAAAPLQAMHDKGLAHHHVRLVGAGVIARLPKQSQMGLAARANLDYQAACFERAAASGHAPRLHGVLPPSSDLPRGGLLVEEIVGRAVRLPHDLPAVARALAAIHSLPLPAQRAPLRDPEDTLAALQREIDAQATHLKNVPLQARSRKVVAAAFDRFHTAIHTLTPPPRRLIAFDAHPGNFLLREDGSAVLVDLEKARYGEPPLDLAHATLYTSTTWDVDSHAELSVPQVVGVYDTWGRHFEDAAAWRPWYVPLRGAMWLWALGWCAKWQALSGRQAAAGADGEDWSGEHSADALVRHVRERVECYLSDYVIAEVDAELNALEREFQA
jgi:thiamine kinase-like enzyme